MPVQRKCRENADSIIDLKSTKKHKKCMKRYQFNLIELTNIEYSFLKELQHSPQDHRRRKVGKLMFHQTDCLGPTKNHSSNDRLSLAIE